MQVILNNSLIVLIVFIVLIKFCTLAHHLPPFCNRASTSQVYNINLGSKEIPVYCHMGDFGCGDGGWTLAMKISGTKVYRCVDWPNPIGIISALMCTTLQTKIPNN